MVHYCQFGIVRVLDAAECRSDVVKFLLAAPMLSEEEVPAIFAPSHSNSISSSVATLADAIRSSRRALLIDVDESVHVQSVLCNFQVIKEKKFFSTFQGSCTYVLLRDLHFLRVGFVRCELQKFWSNTTFAFLD